MVQPQSLWERYRQGILLVLILLIGFLFRLWKLDSIPAEMWGDVNEGYELTQRILRGDFFGGYEFGGDGPLFFYLAAGVSLFTGLSFYAMKIATVIIGVVLILLVYFLGKEYAGWEVGIIAACLTAVSKWAVIFSRMAKPHLLAALFAALSFIFLLKYLRSPRKLFALGLGLSAGFGMYTQAAFWGAFAAVAVFMVLIYIKGSTRSRKDIIFAGAAIIVVLIPFFTDLIVGPGDYLGSGSYYADKYSLYSHNVSSLAGSLLFNIKENILMFHVKGGSTFRNNPRGLPQLDAVSGIFFLFGLIIILFGRLLSKKSNILMMADARLFLIPFFLAQAPSLMDVNNPASFPNAGRTIAIIPWVYIIVAVGIWGFILRLKTGAEKGGKVTGAIFLFVVFAVIGFLNYRQTFVFYPKGLPNNNIPFGRIIAEKIDSLPKDMRIYIVGCCWGERVQPEIKSIRYSLTTKRKIKFFRAGNNYAHFSCEEINKEKGRVYVITDPGRERDIETVKRCLPRGSIETIKRGGYEIMWGIRGNSSI